MKGSGEGVGHGSEGFDAYRLAYEHTPLGIALGTPGRKVIRMNPAMSRMFGRSQADIVSMGIAAITHPDDRHLHRDAHADLIAGRRTSYELERRYIHGDGHVVWAVVTVGAVPDADGQVSMIVAQTRDVSRRRQRLRRAEWRADHDPLTGVLNRSGLRRELDRMLATYDPARPGAVLLVDLDGFKAVNDTAGHLAGDRFLVLLAECVRDAVRTSDAIGRVGGDEFVVLAPDVPGSDEARALAEAVRLAVSVLGAREAPLVGVTASVGVALTPAASQQEILRRADVAMYAAKHAGGDRVAVHGEDVR